MRFPTLNACRVLSTGKAPTGANATKTRKISSIFLDYTSGNNQDGEEAEKSLQPNKSWLDAPMYRFFQSNRFNLTFNLDIRDLLNLSNMIFISLLVMYSVIIKNILRGGYTGHKEIIEQYIDLNELSVSFIIEVSTKPPIIDGLRRLRYKRAHVATRLRGYMSKTIDYCDRLKLREVSFFEFTKVLDFISNILRREQKFHQLNDYTAIFFNNYRECILSNNQYMRKCEHMLEAMLDTPSKCAYIAKARAALEAQECELAWIAKCQAMYKAAHKRK